MAHKRLDIIVKSTGDSRTYKIGKKKLREMRSEISCSICNYHRGCNHNNKTFNAKKGWKEGTKRQKQWKVKE